MERLVVIDWVQQEQIKHPRCEFCGREIIIKKYHHYYGIPRFCHGHNPQSREDLVQAGKIGGKSRSVRKVNAGAQNLKSWCSEHLSELHQMLVDNGQKAVKWMKEHPKVAYKSRSHGGKTQGKKNVESGHIHKIRALSLLGRRPTKQEQLVIDFNIPNLWYCGDGEYWIKSSNKNLNPDFKVCNVKKVVELFGSYWHKDEEVQTRVSLFKNVGYECLVIWEDDLLRYPGYYWQLLEAFSKEASKSWND